MISPGRTETGSPRAQKKDRRTGQALDERSQVLLRRPIDPVQILDHENDRAVLTAAQAPCPERVKRPSLDRLSAELCKGRIIMHAEQVQEVRSVRVRLQPDLLKTETHLLGDQVRVIAVLDATVGAHEVQDWHVRDVPCIGQASAFEVCQPLASQTASKLIDQSRLTNARLTDNSHNLAVAGLDLSQRRPQRRQHLLAPDEVTEHRSSIHFGCAGDLFHQVVESAHLPLAPNELAQWPRAQPFDWGAAWPDPNDPKGLDTTGHA